MRRKRTGPGQSEQAFLAAYDPDAFEHPSLAVDVVLLTVLDEALAAGLVRREAHPHRGRWGLPGTFVGISESVDAAAARALAEKTGLKGVFVEQLYTFGAPKRDPRTRVVSVTYYALVAPERLNPVAGPGLSLLRLNVPWAGEVGGAVEALDVAGDRIVALAFDHAKIIGMAVQRIRGKLDYAPIGFQLLPERFTLRRLQAIHETVLGRPTNKDSFRRRMLASGNLEASGEFEREVGHRPAELYRFVARTAV